MPGTAAGTVRLKHAMVFAATSSGPARLAASAPEITMLGFSSIPSRATRWWPRR